MLRTLRKTASTIALAILFFAPPALMAARAEPDGINHITMMPSGSSASVLRMLVDPGLNRGFSIGSVVDSKGEFAGQKMIVYDLESLRIIDQITPGFDGLDTGLAFVDEVNHQIFFPPGDHGFKPEGCATGPSPEMGIVVFDTITFDFKQVSVPCTTTDQFKVQGLFFHAPTSKLYAVGTAQNDWAPRSLIVVPKDQLGQTLLLRQMSFGSSGSAQSLSLDWEVDLRLAGCDRIIGGGFGAFVGRAGNNVMSYCYGARNSLDGAQGFALRIPVDAVTQQPVNTDPTKTVVATPTLPNDLAPVLDTGSGRLLLLTVGTANGTAVWVYDPANDRFAGVVASGISGPPGGTNYIGLDSTTGRTYFLTSAGMLVADTRQTPLPGGLNYSVMRDIGPQGDGPFIAVAPKLRRLFIPVADKGFAVLRDDVPAPSPEEVLDPDRGTADVPEVAGKTGSVFGASGAGFGLHVLNTGGVPRAVDNVDPSCYSFLSGNFKDAQGRCIADQLLTPGNREMFLAPSQVELGSETGAAAISSGGAFPPADTATDTDFKRLSTCASETIGERAGDDAESALTEFCKGTPLIGFKDGTRGADGDGYPIEASSCEDFGAKEDVDERKSVDDGMPEGTIGSSYVKCNAVTRFVEAKGAAAMLGGTAAGQRPAISIARTATTVTSEVKPEGIVTKVTAEATGVVMGDVSIGRIYSEVTTAARGRSGTAKKTFARQISDVHTPSFSCGAICDVGAVAAAMNQYFGQRARVTIPTELQLASPKGYQSLVLKDPALRDADRASNDDDTFAVSALQIVFFNDGREGRNRLVLQFAGIQAESRYGIFTLPDTSDGILIDPVLETPVFDDFTDIEFTGVETPAGPVAEIARKVGGAVKRPVVLARDTYRLVVNNPKQFAILFVLWTLIASPAYLAARRYFSRQMLTGS